MKDVLNILAQARKRKSRPYSDWQIYISLYTCMGARGIFPEGGGKTTWTDKNDLFFGAPKARTKIFAICSALETKFKVI